ncbi:hypothetical protein SteCoe_33681 [Stentor coeruleus]|uniref:DNA/RNA-binding protein Alba-like domain-containing protein n=1 Tax=Stentor coeruleus TaxID=5963 RepID=A0A1R2AW90_9CILI|nr:hypothetical protein SteCoe_33681 [Stentor coeruleus]
MASNEVMVAQHQGIGQKITQVAILLETQREATITAINLAIPSAINLVEMVKHRVKGLYQINTFERVADSKKTRLIIKLSFNPLDPTNKGYQAPIPEDQVNEKSLEELKKPLYPPRTQGEDRVEVGNSDRPRRWGGRRYYGNEPRTKGEETENQDENSRGRNMRTRRGYRTRRGGYRDYQRLDRGTYRGQGSERGNYRGQGYERGNYRGQGYEKEIHRGQGFNRGTYRGHRFERGTFRGQEYDRGTYGEQRFRGRRPRGNYRKFDEEKAPDVIRDSSYPADS